MKHLRLAVIGVAAIAGLGLASFVTAGLASAEEPGPSGPDAPLAAQFHGHPWLLESIVLAAAQTIDIPPEQVKEALRHGASLAEIGMRHGLRPPELARGIVQHERDILAGMVANGRITPQEARRALAFVTDNIGRIINHHYNPSDV